MAPYPPGWKASVVKRCLDPMLVKMDQEPASLVMVVVVLGLVGSLPQTIQGSGFLR